MNAGPLPQASRKGVCTAHEVVLSYAPTRILSRPILRALHGHDVLTTRQLGAQFAPLCYLSGTMFSQVVHPVDRASSQPVWMGYGVCGDVKDLHSKRLLHAQ
jgi:hypothetical protein